MLKTVVEGVRMTENLMAKAFKQNGLVQYGEKGDKFDPTLHDALFEMPDPELQPGDVAQVKTRCGTVLRWGDWVWRGRDVWCGALWHGLVLALLWGMVVSFAPADARNTHCTYLCPYLSIVHTCCDVAESQVIKTGYTLNDRVIRPAQVGTVREG